MNTFKIEDQVPIPTINRRSNKYPFDKLSIGQSFWVPILDDIKGNIRAAASAYNKRHPAVRLRVSSTYTDGQPGWRVWRIPVSDPSSIGSPRFSGTPPATPAIEDGITPETHPHLFPEDHLTDEDVVSIEEGVVPTDGEKDPSKSGLDRDVEQWCRNKLVGRVLRFACKNAGVSIEEYVASYDLDRLDIPEARKQKLRASRGAEVLR